MTSTRSRLLIVDQSLKDMVGHHYEYDAALLRAAAAAGVPVTVGANRSVETLHLLGENVRAWFQKTWYESYFDEPTVPVRPVRGWLPQALRRLGAVFFGAKAARGDIPPVISSSFGDEVLQLINAERFGPADHLLIHTLSIPEFDSLIEMTRTQHRLPLIHIVLRRDAEEPLVAVGRNGGIRGSLTRLMSSPSAVATLRLYADTEPLARQYSDLTSGLNVQVLPIPHCLLPGLSAEASSQSQTPLCIVYLGDARDEKGFHLLPDLVDAVAGRLFHDCRARFIIQCNIGAAGDTSALSQARRRLAAYPPTQVELIAEQLDIAAFHDLTRSADIVLLPYDRHAYARRSSGILVQALAAGRVVVVPSGTWMAGQVDSTRSVLFEDEASLPDAVVAAVARWPTLSKGAQDTAPVWRAQHDPALFIAQLLNARRAEIG